MRVKVSAPSRLHFALVDLSGDLGRLDGGAGVALKFPRTVVVAEENDELAYEGPRADEVVPKLKRLGLKGKVRVIETPPPHAGFGSTTSLLLSSAKALFELNGIPVTSRELAVFMGRGGTSGVGVAAFEGGGFIVDFGHDAELKRRPLPSGASLTTPPPYLRLEFPEEWAFVISIPHKGVYDERREVSEFLKHTPIPPEESALTARIILMMIIPSILEKDLELFKRGINELQKVGFKRIERELQDEKTKEVCRTFREVAGSAGLSSMGPACFAVVHVTESRVIMEELESKISDVEVRITTADNVGARVF
ncbi:beta-ribofuranosylaminobenzene 5'-phosphate synthase family protein [Ignicoccus hospitalis]|uniref:Beta-ribofuranosylaminobenzene 5'-phosphate synthase n=1 Tax=Ignicoccus hospitalis (strain KIN4/I / DSM 18386 / JCM 14125) TaxID=453591 RepID=A8ACG5_IGNH4|nr:beta-ribofuranosylaminobenzene 5'-phosphate synthase family protein [Ignicoccus hospitalis]ABU82617.1 beta-ribofuranosylaminobenzene 5'-phosphate synthase family [Ignicoccus hospitalis KIN4/I]HIH90613.1 hypothetical protein [Desulfurococcaceae archaeon]